MKAWKSERFASNFVRREIHILVTIGSKVIVRRDRTIVDLQKLLRWFGPRLAGRQPVVVARRRQPQGRPCQNGALATRTT